MAPRRTHAGHCAQRLRTALLSRLSCPTLESQAHRNETLLRAIAVCDHFLTSGDASPQGFQELKRLVRQIVLGKMKTGSEKATEPATSLGGSGLRSSRSSARTRQSSQSTEMDWSLPPPILRRKAFVKGGDFGKIAVLQDQWAKRDDSLRWADRREKRERQRRVLDSQRREIEECRREEEMEKKKERQEMQTALEAYEIQTQKEYERKKELQLATRKMFAEQVHQRQEQALRVKEQEQRENLIAREQMHEENEREKAQKQQKILENRALLQKVQSENIMKLKEKGRMDEIRKEEEKRYNREYAEMLEERENRRIREVEAVKEKQRMLLERGGGPNLQKSLEEQMKIDEMRMQKAQQEYDQKRKEQEEKRETVRKASIADMLAALDLQVAMKREENAKEINSIRKYGEIVAKARRKEVEEEKQSHALHKQQQRQELQELKNRVKQEAKRRYSSWQESMDSIDIEIHKNVADGTERGFTTLPAVKSC